MSDITLIGPKVTLSAGLENNIYKITKQDLAKGYGYPGTDAYWQWVSGLEATNATVEDKNQYYLITPSTDYTGNIDLTYKVSYRQSTVANNSFTVVADSAAPQISSTRFDYYPTPITTNTRRWLYLNFNENVEKGTGNITFQSGDHKIVMNADDFHWYDAHYSRDVPSGTTYSYAQIKTALNDTNAGTKLKQGSTYHVEIDPGFVVDHSGNAFAGVNDNTTITFETVGDGIPPKIISSYPDENQTSVQVVDNWGGKNFRFDILFDEKVKASSGNITITNGSDDTRTYSVSDQKGNGWDNFSTTVRLEDKTGDLLKYGENYSVLIDEGAFVDEAENKYAGIKSATEWKFRTEFKDYPANKSTPAVINYIYQEDHDNNKIVQTIRGTDDDWIKLILDKTSTYKIKLETEDPLNSNSYRHTLKLLDQDENVIAQHGGDLYVKPEINKRINAGTYYLSVASNKPGDYTISVDADFTAPKLVSKVPAYNTNNVDPRSDIVVTYDELVQAGSGEILISDENGDTRRIDINDSSQITINGSSININPTNPLNSNTTYNVQFANGTIVDHSGISAEAISNSKQFSFHTGVNETTAPKNIVKIPSHAHDYKYEELAVHFNQPLTDVAAETTDFNISLDGVNQDIASLRIVNNVVYLKTKQALPIIGDITVTYEPNSDNQKKIQSLAGIKADRFTSQPAKTEIEVAIAEKRILEYDKISGMFLGVNESHVYSLAYNANDYRYDRLKPSSLIKGTTGYEVINGTLTRVDTPILAFSYYNNAGKLIDNTLDKSTIKEGEQIYLVVRDMSNKNNTAMLNRNNLRNIGRVGQGSAIPYRVWSDTRSPATLRGSINSGPVLHLGDIAGTVNIGGSKDNQRLMMPELFDGGLYITFYLMGDGKSGDYIQAFTKNDWNNLDIDELKLYDNKSQVIKTFTGNSGQGAQKIDLNGVKSGEYILKVSNSTTWNPYSLEFKAPASNLEGSTDEAALVDLGVINKDTKRSGLALNKGSDTDLYKFKLTEDSNVGEIFIDYAKGRSDFYIELYKSNQDHLIYKADSGLTYESIKLHDLPEGEYDLKVGSNNNKDGDYSIGFGARATQVDPERYESIKHQVAGDSNSGGKSEQEVVGNETYKHAFFLGNVAPGITNFSNLSINSETDVDYYRIANNLNKSISEITLEFAHGRGDLKLEVLAYGDEITGFDDPKAVVKSSDSKSDDEIVKPYLFGDLIVKVSGVNGATNEYSIKTTVDQPAYKDNVRDADDKDGKEEINPLYLSNGYRYMEKLTIHNPTDVDTYSFTLTEDGTREDHIIIKHPERHASASGNTKYIHYGSRGAVDFNIEAAKVELYDKAGTTLIRSPHGLSSAVEDIYKNTPSYIPGITINNQAYSNKLELDGIPAGDYTIKVSSTKNTAYSIDANAKIKPTITPDRYEANTGNDSLNTAIDLGVLSQATPINNLTITAATNYYKHPKIIAADHDYFKFQVAKKTRDIGTFDFVTTSQRKDYGSKILYQILDANGKVVHGNSNIRQELTGFLLPNIDYYLKFEGQDICTHVSGEEIITPIEYDFTINPIATTLQESYYPASDRFEGKDRNDTRATATSLGLIQGQKTISGLTLDNDNGASEWQGTTSWLRATEWYFLDKQRYEDLADIDIYSFSLDDIYYGFNDNIQLVGNIGKMYWQYGEQLGEPQLGHYWWDSPAVTKNNVVYGEIWSDDFKTYYGESHNLSHLGGGDYHLVVRRTTHESNILSETRNQYDIKFNLTEKDSKTGKRKGDQYEGSEGNNTRETAVWVNELDNWQGDVLIKGSIHTRFDDDWFKFTVPEKIRMNQYIGFMHCLNDINAFIYNEAGEIVESFLDPWYYPPLRAWSDIDAGTYYLKVQAKELKRNYDETVDDYGDYKIQLFLYGGHLDDYLPNENSTHIPRYITSYVGEENRKNYYENATKIDNVYESLDGSFVERKDLALVPSISDHSQYGITTAHEYVFELENRADSGDYIEIRSHQNIAPLFRIDPLPESAGGARLSVSDQLRNSREAKYNRNSKVNRVYLAGLDAGKYSLGVSSTIPNRAIGFNIRSDYDIIINGPPNPEKGDRYEKTSGNQKKNAISIDQSRENVEIKDLTIHYAADRDIFKFVLPRYGTESDFISVEKNISSIESDLLVSLYRENNLPSLQGFKPIEHFLTQIKGRSSEFKRPISKVDRTTTIDLDGLDPATYYVIVESKTPVIGGGVPERAGEPFLPQNYTLNANIPLVNNNEEDIYEALETNESFDLGSISERFKLKGLTITPDDLDKRQFSLSKEGTSEQGIGIEFDHLISNMKLEIVNKDDNSIVIASDYSTADRNYEWVSFENLKAGNYEAIVSGFGGAYNFEFVGGNSSESDYNVKDNTINEAITITEGKISGYSIGGQDKVDYYKFSTNYKSSQRWEREKDNIQIDFWHQLGNIDLELLSEDGSELLAYSYGFENNERIDLVELPADDYILKVIGRGAINNYSLDLNLPTAPPAAEDSLDNHIKENAYRPVGSASTKSWQRWGGWETINATLSPSNTEDWYTATFDSSQPGPSFHTYMNRIGREGKYNEVYVDVYQKIPGEAELQPYHQYNQRSPGAMHQSTDGGFYGAGEYYWKVTGLEMTGVTSYAIRYEEDRLAPQKVQPIPEPLGDVYDDLNTNNWFFERSYDLEKLSPREFVGNQWLNNLGCLERDLDVYTFQLRKKGDQNSYINAYFEQWWKDLDLWLFDNKTLDRIGVKDGSFKGSLFDRRYAARVAQTSSDNESISLDGLEMGEYSLVVVPYQEFVSEASYQLEFNLPEQTTIADPYEPNEEFNKAYEIGAFTGRRLQKDLSIHDKNDIDIMSIETKFKGESNDHITLEYYKPDGLLNLTLLDSAEKVVAIGESTELGTTISLDAIPKGNYYLKVAGQDNDTNNYSINYELPTDPNRKSAWTIMYYFPAYTDINIKYTIELLEAQLNSLSSDVNLAVMWDQPNWVELNENNVTGAGAQAKWNTVGRSILKANSSSKGAGLNNRTWIGSDFEVLSEKNMGDANNLVDFIKWANTEAPAENQALFIHGHSSGLDSIITDIETGGDGLKVEEVALALEDLKTQKLDLEILRLDGCLTGTLEFAYELRNSASYTMGSEAVSGAGSGTYLTHAQALRSYPHEQTPELLAINMVRDYDVNHGQYDGHYKDTLSAIKTDKLADLASAISNFVDQAATVSQEDRIRFDVAREFAPLYGGVSYTIDLGSFMLGVSRATALSQDVRNAALNVVNKLKHAVVAKSNSELPAGGLSIYYPRGGGSSNAYEAAHSQFIKDTKWDQFLSRQVNAGKKLEETQSNQGLQALKKPGHISEAKLDQEDPNDKLIAVFDWSTTSYSKVNAFDLGRLSGSNIVIPNFAINEGITKYFKIFIPYTEDNSSQSIRFTSSQEQLDKLKIKLIDKDGEVAAEANNTQTIEKDNLSSGHYYLEVKNTGAPIHDANIVINSPNDSSPKTIYNNLEDKASNLGLISGPRLHLGTTSPPSGSANGEWLYHAIKSSALAGTKQRINVHIGMANNSEYDAQIIDNKQNIVDSVSTSGQSNISYQTTGSGEEYTLKIRQRQSSNQSFDSLATYNNPATYSLLFTPSDSAGLRVDNSTPGDNYQDVNINSNIKLEFNAPIFRQKGSLQISDGRADIRTINISDNSQVNINGSTLTINPTNDLNPGTSYHVLIDKGAIVDSNGNSFSGIKGTTALDFKTIVDTELPTLSSSGPADDAFSVDLDSNIVLNFSEAVDAEFSNITIYKASDDSTVETIPVTSSQISGSGTSEITINPKANFLSGTEYYIQIAATAFDDSAGHSFAGILDSTTLNFKTADVISPTLIRSFPADNAAAVTVSSNIELDFSEIVDVELGNIILKKSSDHSTVETIPVNSRQISGSGTSKITVNPSNVLESSTGYYLQIQATAFDDAAGNSFVGINDTTSLSFSTADIIDPTLTSSSPADNANSVAIDANILLYFPEVVEAINGNIVINKSSDNSVVETIPVNSSQISGTGTTQITINPITQLQSSTEYYLQIAGTAFDDSSGNSYAGISDSTSLSFTTRDIVAPTLVQSSPADNAIDVAVGSDISLTFSEIVNTNTGQLVLKKTSDNSIVETIDVTSNHISGKGTKQITINPKTDFDSSTEYYLQIPGTAFEDAAGNAFLGISDTTSLSFKTADIIAPTLTSSSPTDNTIAIAVDRNIVLNFSEPVDVKNGNILIKKTADNSTVETISVSSIQVSGSGSKQITINPNSDLLSSTEYYLQIAATAFDDLVGNSYSGISDNTSLSFTTADIIAPTLISSTPAAKAPAIAVSDNFTLDFSEAVDVQHGNIVIKRSSDNSIFETFSITSSQIRGSGTSEITINPSNNLESNTNYYLLIAGTAFDDSAGNSYAGISDTTSLSFKTADIISPILKSSSPADNATAVAVARNILLNFSESIDVESGNIVIKKSSDNSIVESIDVTSSQITGSGTKQIKINPKEDFESSSEYYLQIAATAFDDSAGNSYAGISDTTALSFTTADIGDPTLIDISPTRVVANDYKDDLIAVDSNFDLLFSEAVDVKTGNIVFYKTSDNSVVQTIDVTDSSQVSGTGSTRITINPANNLDSGSDYYAQIDASAFDDSAGNSYAGISDKTFLSFTTEDIVAPTLLRSSPADNEIIPNISSNFSLVFSESVVSASGNIVIRKSSDHSMVETIDVSSSQISGSGTIAITINPQTDLLSNTEYYLQIDDTAFNDLSGNSYLGINDTSSLSFTTADIIAPTLTGSTPSNNTTAFAPGNNIVLQFSEVVDVHSGDIVIKKASDNSTVETIDVTSSHVSGGGTRIITINPQADLLSSSEYYLQIAATAFEDSAHNSYAGISDATSLSFSTADIIAPTLISSSPTDNATVVPISSNIALNFSEPVDLESGNIFIKHTSDNTTFETINIANGQVSGSGSITITINPKTDFLSSTEYYLQIEDTAFDDSSGNSYVGIRDKATFSFSTADVDEPMLISSTPADDDTAVGIGNNIVLNFTEAVDVESGNIVIKTKSDHKTFEAIDVTSRLVSGTGTSQITINPLTNLESETDYYVQIDPSAFDDSAGNSYAGIIDTTSLSFSSADVILPTIVDARPTRLVSDDKDIIEVTPESSLLLTFSEPVDVESGNIVFFKKSDDSVSHTIDVTSAQITGTGTNMITINPDYDFESGSEYYATIAANAFDDSAGNSYKGISDQFTFNFITIDINDGIGVFEIAGTPAVGNQLSIRQITPDPDGYGNSAIAYRWQTSDFGNVWTNISKNSVINIPTTASGKQLRAQLNYTDSEGYKESVTIKAGTVPLETANYAPTELNLSSISFSENVSAGSVVSTLSSIDPDPNDSHTYSLVNGYGDADNNLFSISNNQLKILSKPNYEAQSAYNIRIQTTDSGGLSYQKPFTIRVDDLDDNSAPTALLLSSLVFNENINDGSIVATLTSVDSDIGDSHRYEFVSGKGDEDNDAFILDANQIKIKTSPDYESKYSYNIRLRSIDSVGLYYEDSFNLRVREVDSQHINDTGQATFEILGTAAIGNQLTISQTTADPDGKVIGSIAYRWQTNSDGTRWLDAGTGTSLKIAANAHDQQIRVIASYVDGKGFLQEVVTSNAVVASSSEAPRQQVYSDQATVKFDPSSDVSLPLIYSTSDNNADLSGLTLNIHYNSFLLTPSGLNNGFSAIESTFSNALLDDSSDLDNDPLTNKIVQLTWLDFLSHFPKQQLPANLGTLKFSPIADVDDEYLDQLFDSPTDEPPSTNVRYTASATATDYDFLTGSTTLVANEPSFNLDIDGDGNVTPLGDGLMLIRKLIGPAFVDDALTNKARSVNATRSTEEIHKNIQKAIDSGVLDVDGDGKTTPLGDGLMIIRNLIGPAFAGDALTNKAMSSDSPYFGKTDAADLVTANIDALRPLDI